MYYKLVGSGMILASTAWAGFHAALRLRRTQEELRDLCAALELMAGEIRFAAPPLAPLCRRAGEGRCPGVKSFFAILAREAEKPELALEGMSALACREAGMALPGEALRALARLFDGFGRLDREAQLRQIELAAAQLRQLSGELSQQMDSRCRSFRLLGLTAGAAVLVLVL